MLVLSRVKNETIMIGDDVEITIVDVKGDKVRVGIKAPKNVPVHRKEVYLAIKEENLRAAEQPAALDLGALDLGVLGDLFKMQPPPNLAAPRSKIEPPRKDSPESA
ncbi:MAG: carbon storage regulator CsrA [Planctomycetes bacterium]|nr:carbon storage regulator CsrA [Planctomycetota bacterium]